MTEEYKGGIKGKGYIRINTTVFLPYDEIVDAYKGVLLTGTTLQKDSKETVVTVEIESNKITFIVDSEEEALTLIEGIKQYSD